MTRRGGKLEALLGSVFAVRGQQKGPVALAISSTVLADFLLWLEMAGTAKTKRIPGWIFGLPASERLAFIEGYLDTDGHVRERGDSGRLTFVSANGELLDDVKFLAITCGLTPGKISRYVKDRKLAARERKQGVRELIILDGLAGQPCRDPVARASRWTARVHTRERDHAVAVAADLRHRGRGCAQLRRQWSARAQLEAHDEVPRDLAARRRAHGEVLSIAFAGAGQHQDAGGKCVHVAPDTTSVITSKSISKNGGRAGYRGLLRSPRARRTRGRRSSATR